jgi:signal transduction histidine kinase
MSDREEREQAQEHEAGRLCDFVDARREDILREWEARARALLATAQDLSGPALRDHLPGLLVWIGEVVRTAHEGGARTPGLLAEAHAQLRLAEGYSVTEVSRELSLLRQVILELWDAQHGPSVLVNEVLRLNEVIDLVLARSVRAFADAQQREVRERLDIERQMIGVVSHELRNPIQTILVAAEGLLLLSPDNRALRAIVRIRNAALRTGRLLRDLLDFTQARLGPGIHVTRAPADLHAIARDVVEEQRVLASHHDLRHVEEGDGSALLDPDRIAQVVHNLVSNACKYGAPESEVTVRTRGERDTVVLTVHNQGEPIPPEMLERLFEPLHRGPGRRGDGVGLGLYIVESIVRAHGGAIAVTSSAEEGTVFAVRLPRAPASTGNEGSRPAGNG